MRVLEITRDEALQVITDDLRIDQGEKLFELNKEQQQASKQARQVSRKPTVYKFNKRERKPNEEKRFLINFLVENLNQVKEIQNLEITNKEREIVFTFDEKKFKIVLSAPRK